MSFLQPLARRLAASSLRFAHRAPARVYSTSLAHSSKRLSRPLLWGGALTVLAFSAKTVYCDASTDSPESEETVVDPSTSIAFPKIITVPAKVAIPPLTLVGVGVRTVTFLGFKVYSAGLYVDLKNPNLHITPDMTPEQKIKHIVLNTDCVLRIVATRSTGMTHLRDGFVRALNARLVKAKQSGELTEEQIVQEGSPLRKLAGLFPNTPLFKHIPFDIFIPAPQAGKPRVLIFRDLGIVESDWLATNFVLSYVEPDCPSPPLKDSVLKNIADFEK
ncbi:hypothetical protein Agabi119p4_879 [Agaricus bisporus var. burnettii]|uniref:Chalcone isomerase domain-containing protein n=1 Tax=Agaricus bisporus var. burnettii TaxID=192524 RepID=A0A8H7FBJ9_AGABI|nr:hypothetical protein Agabi119p4_879 [Agaricus bisporus var. burnettii]